MHCATGVESYSDSDSLGYVFLGNAVLLRGIDLDVFKLPFAIDLHIYAVYKANNYALTLITGRERSLCLSRYE